MMDKTVDIDMETTCKKPETALNRFFRKYPELEGVWRETFEYMISEGVENFSDKRMADGSYNDKWGYSLWFVDHDGSYYIAVVLREDECDYECDYCPYKRAVAFTERIDREPLYICGLYEDEED